MCVGVRTINECASVTYVRTYVRTYEVLVVLVLLLLVVDTNDLAPKTTTSCSTQGHTDFKPTNTHPGLGCL